MSERMATEVRTSEIRVVLAMSHARTRVAVRQALETTEDIAVVAEVSSALQVLQVARSEHVDVVMFDLRLVPPGSLPSLAGVVRGLRGIPVVAVGLEADPAFARDARAAGAISHVLTDASPDDYLGAVRAAAHR
jgi:DNA-binding NarL/FixJ family response regulator